MAPAGSAGLPLVPEEAGVGVLDIAGVVGRVAGAALARLQLVDVSLVYWLSDQRLL
jgi:hypothetical protein